MEYINVKLKVKHLQDCMKFASKTWMMLVYLQVNLGDDESYRLSGLKIMPTTYISLSNEIELSFRSDESVTYNGFLIIYSGTI